jgi:hypothetical protein
VSHFQKVIDKKESSVKGIQNTELEEMLYEAQMGKREKRRMKKNLDIFPPEEAGLSGDIRDVFKYLKCCGKDNEKESKKESKSKRGKLRGRGKGRG